MAVGMASEAAEATLAVAMRSATKAAEATLAVTVGASSEAAEATLAVATEAVATLAIVVVSATTAVVIIFKVNEIMAIKVEVWLVVWLVVRLLLGGRLLVDGHLYDFLDGHFDRHFDDFNVMMMMVLDRRLRGVMHILDDWFLVNVIVLHVRWQLLIDGLNDGLGALDDTGDVMMDDGTRSHVVNDCLSWDGHLLNILDDRLRFSELDLLLNDRLLHELDLLLDFFKVLLYNASWGETNSDDASDTDWASGDANWANANRANANRANGSYRASADSDSNRSSGDASDGSESNGSSKASASDGGSWHSRVRDGSESTETGSDSTSETSWSETESSSAGAESLVTVNTWATSMEARSEEAWANETIGASATVDTTGSVAADWTVRTMGERTGTADARSAEARSARTAEARSATEARTEETGTGGTSEAMTVKTVTVMTVAKTVSVSVSVAKTVTKTVAVSVTKTMSVTMAPSIRR